MLLLKNKEQIRICIWSNARYRDILPWVPETFLSRFSISVIYKSRVHPSIVASAFGRHRRLIPLHARKTSGTQGRDSWNTEWNKVIAWLFSM